MLTDFYCCFVNNLQRKQSHQFCMDIGHTKDYDVSSYVLDNHSEHVNLQAGVIAKSYMQGELTTELGMNIT